MAMKTRGGMSVSGDRGEGRGGEGRGEIRCYYRLHLNRPGLFCPTPPGFGLASFNTLVTSVIYRWMWFSNK